MTLITETLHSTAVPEMKLKTWIQNEGGFSKKAKQTWSNLIL